ncbi:MAG: hypothetical protein GY771_03215 [bacterium]|nr:hypothetical protein [bacterium]
MRAFIKHGPVFNKKRRSESIAVKDSIFPPYVPWGKVFLRPIGLPVFLLSLPLVVFFPPVTIIGAALYAGSCYWAYQKYRNKMFPPGTTRLIRSVPYRRRRSAHLALEYAKDIQAQIAALPPEVQSRVPVADEEVGAMAATAVKMYVYEENFRRLADEGTEGAREQAEKTAGRAAKIIEDLKQLQRGVLGVSLASSTSDIALMDDAASAAIEEVGRLRRSIEGARAEIDRYIESEGLPDFVELEARAAEKEALKAKEAEEKKALRSDFDGDDSDIDDEGTDGFDDGNGRETKRTVNGSDDKPAIPEPKARPEGKFD